MRICEPFDPELRKGLWLYHILEPGTLVPGLCAGPPVVQGMFSTGGSILVGRGRKNRPTIRGRVMPVFCWTSLPQPVEEHYRTKIAVYLHWCRGASVSLTKTTTTGSIWRV